METTDQPNRECDLLESRTTASVRGATIHCTDNAERMCSSPATGGKASVRGATIHCTDNAERMCSSPATGGKTVKVRRELRQMFPMYECYIAARSHVDVGNDENDRTLVEEYARNKAQITVVTFLHKRVFQTNALARTWYKPRDMSALEHMVQGRVPWLEAKKHDKVSIGIVNVHQATAKRHDLQRQVNLLLWAMIDAALT